MSGICGIWESGASWDPSQLSPMLSGIALAGDAPAQVFAGKGALFGAVPRWPFQAVASHAGIIVAASADLCNVSELEGATLSARKSRFPSSADLIAELYRVHGLRFIDQLRGSFAFAIWDSTEQQLVLAVDQMGLETLFWTEDHGRLLFGTRVGAVASARSEAEIDTSAVVQFLVHTVVPAPLTIYKNIQRLQAGSVLVYRDNQTSIRKYWDISYDENEGHDEDYWAEELRSCMRSAVHSCASGLDSSNTGAYLSGGTDSSSVLAFASELLHPVNTFSIYFENPRYDEIRFARTAARKFGAHHHEHCLQAADAVDVIPRLIEHFDEPFGNSSAIGAFHCARLARQHGVDMLLAGDGGDELFAGNERYATDRQFALYHSIPKLLREGFIKPAANVLPKNGVLSLPARYIRRSEIPNPRRMFSYSFFLAEADDSIFDRDLLTQVPRSTWMNVADSHYQTAPAAKSDLNRLLYLDVKMTLGDNDIRKVRGSAEMAGVHVRFPLMDSRLAELSGRIPANLKLRRFEKRYIFKEAMRGILPDEILFKKKHGFGVPLGYWALQNKHMRDLAAILDEPKSRQRGYFAPGFLARLQGLNASHPAYYGEVMWLVLVLELWHRKHFESRTSQTCTIGSAYAS